MQAHQPLPLITSGSKGSACIVEDFRARHPFFVGVSSFFVFVFCTLCSQHETIKFATVPGARSWNSIAEQVNSLLACYSLTTSRASIESDSLSIRVRGGLLTIARRTGALFFSFLTLRELRSKTYVSLRTNDHQDQLRLFKFNSEFFFYSNFLHFR